MIVGDVMIDRYLTGSVNRISPEAPVPVVLQQNMEDRLGGAANVALNIHALGSTPVLCSVIGRDEAPPKPDPGGLLHLAAQWQVQPQALQPFRRSLLYRG